MVFNLLGFRTAFKLNVHLIYVKLFVDALFYSVRPVKSRKSPWMQTSEEDDTFLHLYC